MKAIVCFFVEIYINRMSEKRYELFLKMRNLQRKGIDDLDSFHLLQLRQIERSFPILLKMMKYCNMLTS